MPIHRPEPPRAEPVSHKIIYPSPRGRGIIKVDDESREGPSLDKIAFALSLPFRPGCTETLLDLERFEDLKVDTIRSYTTGLILGVEGTLVAHHSENFAEPVVKKLIEIRDKMKVCIFSNNAQGRPIFEQLGIPVVKHAAPKPEVVGFRRAAQHYLNLSPGQCTMVGDNILTDGGARQAGMQLILVDPIPGREGFFHKLTRGYGRAIKSMHDAMYGSKKRIPKN